MNALLRTIEWIIDKMRVVGAACLVGMTFLTCVDVIGRFFRHPIFGSVEIVGFMATTAVAMALPYTDKIRGHVGVELVVRLLSERLQIVIDICTRVISLALFCIITWRMTVYAYDIQKSGEVSMNLEFPEYLIIYIASFCLLMSTIVILQDIMINIKKLKGK